MLNVCLYDFTYLCVCAYVFSYVIRMYIDEYFSCSWHVCGLVNREQRRWALQAAVQLVLLTSVAGLPSFEVLFCTKWNCAMLWESWTDTEVFSFLWMTNELSFLMMLYEYMISMIYIDLFILFVILGSRTIVGTSCNKRRRSRGQVRLSHTLSLSVSLARTTHALALVRIQ